MSEITTQSTVYSDVKKKHEIDLVSVKLYKDPVWGYCLNVTYRIETPEEIREVNIPKMRLNITPNWFTISTKTDGMYGCHHSAFADIGFGAQELLYKGNYYYTEKVVKTKTKEMTLDEIEKKLGHKVKIVNK